MSTHPWARSIALVASWLTTAAVVSSAVADEQVVVRAHPLTAIVETLNFREALAFKRHAEFAVSEAVLRHMVAASDLRGASATMLIEELELRAKSIYGEDNREDIYRVEEQRRERAAQGLATTTLDAILHNARSVALVVSKWELASCAYGGESGHENGPDCELDVSTYGTPPPRELCPNERFVGQPKAGRCTAFIVGEQLLATAGHCVTKHNVKNLRFIFDFRLGAGGDPPPARVPVTTVYAGVSLLDREYQTEVDGYGDWALINIDQPITDRDPLPIRRTGAIDPGDGVYVIGHPRGLPLKVARRAEVLPENMTEKYFSATLDTYKGNSGSPVFHAGSHRVEGILVRGGEDYTPLFNGEQQCYVSVLQADDTRVGEHVNRTAVFQEKVP